MYKKHDTPRPTKQWNLEEGLFPEFASQAALEEYINVESDHARCQRLERYLSVYALGKNEIPTLPHVDARAANSH